ncbi:MAG: hypothetical protein IPJ50_06230 [Betaproteobacteria bacterium]|nr:hypothetical protein [Betaproteobacteria bacterium]
MLFLQDEIGRLAGSSEVGVKVGQRPAQRNLDARQREIRSPWLSRQKAGFGHGEQSGGPLDGVRAAKQAGGMRAKRPECGIASGVEAPVVAPDRDRRPEGLHRAVIR